MKKNNRYRKQIRRKKTNAEKKEAYRKCVSETSITNSTKLEEEQMNKNLNETLNKVDGVVDFTNSTSKCLTLLDYYSKNMEYNCDDFDFYEFGEGMIVPVISSVFITHHLNRNRHPFVKYALKIAGKKDRTLWIELVKNTVKKYFPTLQVSYVDNGIDKFAFIPYLKETSTSTNIEEDDNQITINFFKEGVLEELLTYDFSKHKTICVVLPEEVAEHENPSLLKSLEQFLDVLTIFLSQADIFVGEVSASFQEKMMFQHQWSAGTIITKYGASQDNKRHVFHLIKFNFNDFTNPQNELKDAA